MSILVCNRKYIILGTILCTNKNKYCPEMRDVIAKVSPTQFTC